MSERDVECAVVRLEADGTPVLRLQGQEQAFKIHGIEILQPPSSLAVDLLTHRIARLPRPPRCRRRGERVQIFVFAWQDKSGEVWEDLARVLLEQGVARVADGDFPEREAYRQAEQRFGGSA